jgi:hypothetical protein
MNHIHRLQADLDVARAALHATDQALREFRAHLVSEKFQGFEPDGSRKDWIAIADVDARLCGIIAIGSSP